MSDSDSPPLLPTGALPLPEVHAAGSIAEAGAAETYVDHGSEAESDESSSLGPRGVVQTSRVAVGASPDAESSSSDSLLAQRGACLGAASVESKRKVGRPFGGRSRASKARGRAARSAMQPTTLARPSDTTPQDENELAQLREDLFAFEAWSGLSQWVQCADIG